MGLPPWALAVTYFHALAGVEHQENGRIETSRLTNVDPGACPPDFYVFRSFGFFGLVSSFGFRGSFGFNDASGRNRGQVFGGLRNSHEWLGIGGTGEPSPTGPQSQ